MKKTYTPEFKAKIVLEALRGENTINEIASKYEVHPIVLTRWKTEAIENLAEIFENKKNILKERKQFESQKDELYKEIGKLSTQLEWLKKKSGIQIQ